MVPVCDKRYHTYNRFRHFWAVIKKLWNYPLFWFDSFSFCLAYNFIGAFFTTQLTPIAFWAVMTARDRQGPL